MNDDPKYVYETTIILMDNHVTNTYGHFRFCADSVAEAVDHLNNLAANKCTVRSDGDDPYSSEWAFFCPEDSGRYWPRFVGPTEKYGDTTGLQRYCMPRFLASDDDLDTPPPGHWASPTKKENPDE